MLIASFCLYPTSVQGQVIVSNSVSTGIPGNSESIKCLTNTICSVGRDPLTITLDSTSPYLTQQTAEQIANQLIIAKEKQASEKILTVKTTIPAVTPIPTSTTNEQLMAEAGITPVKE